MLGDSIIWETSVRLVASFKESAFCLSKIIVFIINTNLTKLVYKMLDFLMFVLSFN